MPTEKKCHGHRSSYIFTNDFANTTSQLTSRSQLAWLSICCNNKEINFFQDIGDSASFDLERVTKDDIINDQIMMAVLQETLRKSNFFITFGCLVSADQPTVN